jgi:N-acetyl-anhydromuramyl-L-alanine amidase AmpD
VIHTPEGGESATLDVLNDVRASFDFYLPLSGTLYQCNNYEAFIAWQAGDWTYNRRSIGIEQGDFAANSGEFPEEHYRRLAQLVAWLIQETSTPLRYASEYGEDGLIDHATITPASRSDPGAGFRRDLLLQFVHEILEQPEEDPAVIEQLQNQIRDLEAQIGEKDRRLMDAVSSLGYVSGDVAAALEATASSFKEAVTPLESLDSAEAQQVRQQVLETVENGLRPIVNTLRDVQPPG